MVNIARTVFGLDKTEPAGKIQHNRPSIDREAKRRLISRRKTISSEEE